MFFQIRTSFQTLLGGITYVKHNQSFKISHNPYRSGAGTLKTLENLDKQRSISRLIDIKYMWCGTFVATKKNICEIIAQYFMLP